MFSPQKRQRKPSPIVSEPEGPDLIGRLPDSILHSILSLVPVKDAARTSVLSSRWRYLWEEAPLRLDDSSINPDDLSLVFNKLKWSRKAVSSIFYSHHGPIESLRLSRFNRPQFHPEMERLVESAAQRGIRELTLGSKIHPWEDRYLLPPSLLRCNSLRQLSLSSCRFPEVLLPSIFPNLKELRLNSIPLSNDLLQILLSESGSLETLQIYSGDLPRVVSISSPSLRKLVWKECVTEELIIKDAPNLEAFLLDEDATIVCNVKVLDAPKLQLLGFLSVSFDCLQLGGTFFDRRTTPIFQVKQTLCQMKMLSSVKSLAIDMDLYFNDTVPDLLRCFPCLENLYILVRYDGDYRNPGLYDLQGSFGFADHVKTVTWKGFSGDAYDLELVRNLVVHGKVLQKITLLCFPCTGIFEETIRKEVCFEKRASSDLELVIFIETEDYDHFSQWEELIKF